LLWQRLLWQRLLIDPVPDEAETRTDSFGNAVTRFALHRGHELLRNELLRRAGTSSAQAFGFHAVRCDRVVEGVFRRLNFRPERE